MIPENTKNKVFDKKMKQFISFVKDKEKIKETDILSSWDTVEKLVDASKRVKEKKRVRYFIAGLSAAASIALVLIFSPYVFQSATKSSYISELDKEIVPQDSLNQIYLVLSEDRKVELENESVVCYNNEGDITVNSQSTRITKGVISKEKQLNHIIVPKGKRTHLTLSDGTRIYVNADSHVIYPSVFNDDKREIAVEGEVYLEVAQNPKVPFIVKVKGLDVKVLGTTFNVSAYKEQEISVVLVNGSVEVKSSAKEKMVLSPSQRVCLKDGVMKKENVDVLKYICWKDNVMLLDNDATGDVLERIARYYGVPIWYDHNIADRKLSGKLDLCESIEDVLDIIRESASLRMEKTEGNGFHFMK